MLSNWTARTQSTDDWEFEKQFQDGGRVDQSKYALIVKAKTAKLQEAEPLLLRQPAGAEGDASRLGGSAVGYTSDPIALGGMPMSTSSSDPSLHAIRRYTSSGYSAPRSRGSNNTNATQCRSTPSPAISRPKQREIYQHCTAASRQAVLIETSLTFCANYSVTKGVEQSNCSGREHAEAEGDVGLPWHLT